jgi:hypothetical protein
VAWRRNSINGQRRKAWRRNQAAKAKGISQQRKIIMASAMKSSKKWRNGGIGTGKRISGRKYGKNEIKK